MPCTACSEVTGDGSLLCGRCHRTLRPGGELRIPGGVTVRAAYAHEGAARRLVHLLKYAGPVAAAEVLGRAMAAAAAPIGPAAMLVPVPRVLVRRWRYGVDPAAELARVVGRHLGVPVVAALRPGWWHPHRAGAGGRSRPRFTLAVPLPAHAVLVDDVVTTGTTLVGAAAACRRPLSALVATAPAASREMGPSDR